jgi:plasmid replication initiation protein
MVDEFKEFSAPAVPAQSSATFKKPVETIAIIPKSGKVTLLTRKLFNVLLDIAQQHNQKMGEDVPVYRTALSKITTNANFNSNDTALIKEHLRKMNSIQVEWNPGKSKDVQRRWGVTSLMAEAEVIEDPYTHRTFIEWSYSPKLKKRLLEPDVYTRISLQMQSALRSGASLSLYEICYRYATSPNSLTMREMWEWWRPALTGSPDDEMEKDTYREYKYFKRDVLKPAISEVNAVTDLTVELLEHKEGRRIVELQFRVTRKAQSNLPLIDRSLLNMGLIKKMLDLGLSQEEAERIYSDTEESLIEVSLKAVEARKVSKRQAPLENPGAWFLSVLKRGATAKPAALPKAAKPKASPKQSLDDLRAKYQQQQRNDARAMFAEMPDEDQIRLGDKFREYLFREKNTSVLEEYDRKGLGSKRVEVAFFFWLAEDTWGPPTDKDLLEFALS